MATQADVPEVILHKKLEVEDTSLTTVQFEKAVNETFLVEVTKYESVLHEYPETQESQADSENKQVACSTQVEITDNLANGNSGTSEGGIFLASLSGSAISSKEASGQEDFQIDEHTRSEVEISETAKHLEKGQQFEAVKETAREDEVVEEKNREADQFDKNLGQNEEEILNQKDSVDEGLGSTEKEIKDSEKDEKEGEMEESQAQLSSKEIPRIPEVTLDHKNVQSVAVTCPEEENMDNMSSAEAILLKKEYTEERSLEETKEEGKCVDLVTNGKGSEEICSSENKGNEDEKNQITHDNVGNSTLSTVSINREESQNNETDESVKDEIERVIVTDEPGDQEAGIAEKEKHEEFAGPASSEDANDLSRQEKDKVPIKNEVQDKDSLVTLFVAKAEEACSQEKDNPEILKESSKIELDYIAKETPIEVTKHTEILEETTQVKGTASGDINGHENPEQKLGISSRKPNEEIYGKDEGLDTTEPAVEVAQNTEASSLVTAEDINSVKLIQAEELTEAESTKHEDHPDDNLLPQNETVEKFQTHFNVVSEETKSIALRGDATTVTSIKEEGEIKSLEESFEESEEITNLPLTRSDKKTESTEAEFPNNDANNSNATHLLVEQAEVQGEKIDEVSKLESHENDQASYETLAKVGKHAEAESEGYQITEKTFVSSTEEIPPTETIVNAHTGEPKKDCGVSSKESLASLDAGENESEETKVEAEVTDLDLQKFRSSQESEESSTLDDIPTNVENTVGKIPEEEASKPTSEDESHKQEGIAADFNKEQISERDIVFSTPKMIKEGTSKSFEDNVKNAEKLSEAEIPTEIIKEGNINDLTSEKIQEDATDVLKDHEHEVEKSKEEVLEELETVAAGENIPYETKNIEKIVDAPSVEEEEVQHEEGKYLDRTEASIEESKVEIAVEEALKSRGEDEVHIHESMEENVNKEQTIEKDVTFSTPESVQEATSEGSQDNIKAVENLNEEESTVEIIKEDKLDDLSPENTQEDATITLEDPENEAEKSKEKIVDELETARLGESISCETNKDVESFVDASSVQQEVKDQDQGPIKAPTEENKVEIVEEEALKSKHEEESHKQEAESNKKQIIEEGVAFSAAESTQEEKSKTSQENVKYAEKLNEEESTVERLPENKQGDEIQLNDHENEAEKCIEGVVQESDTSGPTESISFKTNKDGEKIVDTSSIKQEEGQQEEGKYQDPNKASIEENKVETPKEEGPKSKDEDENHEQESTAADFDKEQILEEDTFSTLESIQEETSKSSQDNINDAEKINEEHPAETMKEGNTNNLSPKNIQGDTIEVLRDHENEVEKSEEEVFEELETAGLGESIQCKTNKDVEKFEDTSSVKQDAGQQEQGKYLDPTGASIEENKPEDEALKSRGDDGSHRQESTEADFNKEQIVEREVTFCTPELIQEDTSKTSQVDVKDAERNDEESTTERTKVGETNDLSGENVQGDTVETLKDHENEEEKSKKEVVEELEAAKVNESISCETNKGIESYVDASSVKQEEGRQEEGKYTDPNGALIEENKVEIPEKEALKLRGEDESHRKESTEEDFKKEHIIVEEVTFSTPESIQHETSERSQDNIKDAEKINEESTIEITKEGSTNDLSQENIQEDAVEASKEEHENEVGESKEEVAQELETTGPSESIPFETKKDVEKTVDTSSVTQEEALTEENKFEDKFSTEVVKNFDDNEVTATERGIELASKRKEDQQQVMQEDKPEETLEDLLQVTTEATKTEKSSEMDRELTCAEVEKSIQNLNETSETKKEEEKSKNMDTDDSEKEICKEIETAEASESSPCDINEDAESSIDDSLVKQEEGPKEEVKYIDQAEASTEENKLVETVAARVAKDDEENKVLDASSKGKEDQQQATQKDEPEEKLDNLISVTPEEIETETTTENARSITSLEVEGTSQNHEEIFETEETKYMEDTNDSEKETSKELETAGSGESIPCKTNEDIEHSVDSSSINQEDQIQQEEAKYLHQVDASIEENKFVDTYSTEVVKEDDGNKVEVAEKRIEVSSNDEEDQQQATQKDEPGERLEMTLVETETEPSSEIARESTSVEVEGTVQNIDKTVETENEEEKTENMDGANELEKEIHEELETTGACKSVPCKINEDASSSFDASSVKQDESKKEEVKYIDQVQASIGENKLEETSTAELVEVDDDNKVSNVASKAEEDQQQATQKDKPDEKLENLHHVTPEETEIETSAENATNNTSVGVEIIAQNLEETLEKEKIEHVDGITDSERELTQELETVGTDESIPCKTNEEVEGSVVTLSVKQDGQHEEDKELDQIDALKEENEVEDSSSAEVGKQDDDSKFDVTKKEIEEEQQPAMPKDEPEQKLEDLPQATPKETEVETSSGDAINITCVEGEGTVLDVEDKEENMKNADDAKDSEKQVLENTSVGQEAREQISREIVGESSKEVEKEEDKSSGSKEQTEVSDLIEDIKPENLEDSAKPNEELCTKTTTEALEEEKLAEEETQEREVAVHGGTDSGSAGILAEEISIKEAKPDDKEEVQSYEVFLSEKGSENNQVESESVLTENLSEETSLKEGEVDNEEQLKSSDVAPEDGLKSIAGSVLTDIVRERAFLKEVKSDVEEKIESSDVALIDKGPESNGDPVSTEILIEETFLKEAKPDDEQEIKNSDAVSEEKGVSSSADVGLESDSVATESSFDTSLVKQEESQQEEVKYIDQARASIKDNKLDETFTTEVVKVEDENKISNVASKSEEDQQQAAQKEKPEEKLETLLHVTPKEMETETSTENARNISSMGVERISRNVEETSAKEKIEHVDSTNDSEKEVIEITSAGEESREEVPRDIVEEGSKEVEKEGDNSWQSKEQNEVADLIEEIKPESVVDSAKPNEDLYAKTTAEAPEEEKLAEEEMQKKEPIAHDGTDSGSSGILAKETSMKEAKPYEEEGKSYDIAPEDKGVTSIAGSVSTEIVSQKTLLKEVKTDDEEKIKSSDNALQEKDLESSGDPVSTEIVSKEACPKEAKPDNEEQIKNSDAVSKEKGVSSSADVGLELDSVSTESSFDASLVKKEETQQEEVKYIDQARALIAENKLLETFTAEVVKVDNDNKVSNVASRGEEDQPQATQKDKPDEKLENLLHVTPEETETETSTENATNITCVGVEGIAPNLEETSEIDKSEHVHGTNDSTKKIPRELETARTDESTPSKTNEDVERSVANLLMKQEGQYEEDKKLDQIDALKEENKAEDSSSTEVVKQDDENKVEVTKREIEEDQQPATPKDEPEQKLEDLLQVTPKETEAGTSSGDAIDITCMEGERTSQDVEETLEVEKKEENMKNTDDANEIEKEVIESASAGHKTREEISRDIVEESSKEVEKEEDKSSECKEQNEVVDFIEEINPESLEDSAEPNEDLYTKTTTEAPEEEKLAEEETQEKEPAVHDGTDPGSAGVLVEETSTTETKPYEEEVRSYDIAPEDMGLMSIAGSLSTGILSEETCTTEVKTDVEEQIRSANDALEEKGLESGGDPISAEIVLETTSESQETREVSTKIVEKSSKEVEKEEDKGCESKEQNEVADLIKEIKPESLEDSANPNEDLYAKTTTKAPEEEKLSEEETQEKEPLIHDGTDSGSAEILVEETSVTEAKPDEEVGSYDIAPEDQGLTSIAGSVSTEIVSEEACTKELKTEVEKKIRSYDDKGPESSGDPISTEIVLEPTSESQETREVSREIVEESSKEVDKEEDKSSESREQNEVATLIEDIKPKSLQESAKQNEEFYATTTTEAPEEEKLAEEETQEKETVIHDGTDSVSAGILVEDTSVTEAKPDEGEVRSYDIAPEDKGLTSIAGSVSTEIVSEETCTKESKTEVEEKIGSFDNALEEKGQESSGDPISTEIVLETTSESQETREASREIVEESLKEIENEDKSSKSREQNEVATLIEDIKPESLQESAKQNEEFYATTTTEAPEEEKLAEEETQEKEPVIHNGTDSGSAGILVEETSMTEAKPDEEEIRSYDIAPEDKGLTSTAGSVSTEIVSEEICTKESKTDVEEKIRSSGDALEEKGPEGSRDPILTEFVLETTSESQETREVSREIVEESSKEVEKEEDKSSESREQNEVATLIKDIKPESLQESAKQIEEFYAITTTEAPEEEKLAKEETQEKEPAIHDGAESESAGILTEETSIKEAKPDDKEEVRSYEVSLEDKASENNQVQSESVLTEKLKGEVELKEEEPDNEEQLKSCDISPEDEGLTSIAGSVSTEIASENTFLKEVKTDDEEKIKSSDNALEEKDLKSSSDPISTEIVLETTSVGLETKEEESRDIVEESLKEVEKEEQKSFESKEQNEVVALIEDIKLESLEDSAKPNEDLHSKTTTEAPEEEKLAEEETQEKEPTVHDGSDLGSAGTLAEETSVKEAKPDDKEKVKSYGISLREKGLENIQVQPESVVTENLSEETGLKEGEPGKEEQLKSCDIAPEDVLKSIVSSVSTENVSEKTLLKEVNRDDEEKIKSPDNAFEEKDLERNNDPVSAETVSEETCLKKAKPDDEVQIKNSDAIYEEKGASSSIDVGLESDFVSTGISNEEARVKEAELDYEEQVKSCDIATEEKGLERSVDVDVQSDFASTKIESEETGSKEAEPETVEQVKSYDVASEEKGIEEQSDSVSNEIVCAETCLEEDKQDRGDQVNDSVIAPEEKSLASSLDAKIVSEETAEIANEEMRLKEGKEDKEEHVQCRDFALERESLVSDADVIAKSASVSAESVSEETGVKEIKRDQDEPVRSSNIVFEEKSLESSLDTKIASEEISLEAVKPDDEEQVNGSASEKESLVTYMDAKVQSDSVSAGKESEERCLEKDKPRNEDKVRSPDIALEEESLVSEETGGKEAESDNKEEVRHSDIAPEEKGGVSNVVSEVQQNENVKSEEIEEDKGQELTSECEEKIEQEIKGETPIAGTENKEQDTMAETPLEDSSEDNLQDSSTVPSTEHEPVITEATERSDATTAIDKTECENANLPIIEPTKEEELLQEEYDSKLESHTEKEIVNEEIQRQREEDLSATPEITSKDAIPTEVHEGVEKAVENESSVEQVTDKEIDLKETQTESIEDERVYEEKDSVATVTEVVKATEADEHISSQAKETSTEKNEEFAPTAPEDERINDEGSLKPVDDRIASREEGKIEEKVKREVDNPCDNNDTTTAEEEKEAESETIVEESYAVTEVKETELASDTEDVNAAKPIPAVEKLETDEIKEEIKEESECQGVKAANQGEITSEQAEKLESSATLLEKEEERQGKEETEEDIKTAHETVSKDEVNVGVSTEQVQELETSQVVKQTEDSLVEEKAEETKLKEDTEEEITVSAIANETIEDHTVLAATSKREEQDSENACSSSAKKTAEEACVQEEEPREIKFSDETKAETKDASITVSESDSQSIAIIAKEDEKITCETFTESATEVQLLEQSYVLLPTEEENGITTAAKEKIEERTTEDTCSMKEVLGGDKIEAITEASEIASKEKSPDIEIDKDQIEQEHETAAIVKKIEEEETKEEAKLSDDKTLEDSSAAKTVEKVDDVRKGLNEVSKIEPQKSDRSTRDADSPSVVEASNLNIEKREIASDFVSAKVESPEALASIEEVEIIENHLKVASTDLRTEEPQCETTIQAEKATEREILAKEELSTEISQEKGVLDVEKVHGIIQEIKQPEESSHATCKEQTPTEAEGKESLEKGITTSDKDAPPKLTDPVEEASQRAEPNDTKPKNDNVSVNREIFETAIKKEEYCQGGNETGGSKTETKPAVISLSDLMQSSKEETDQVAEHSTEEREETRKNGKEAEKTKTDEERDGEEEEEDDEHEHEHEEADHPDAPILVQTSKDIDPKVGRKKSHGLFSGVGSKVKHSISKVKKAITGKSSHSKTQPSS